MTPMKTTVSVVGQVAKTLVPLTICFVLAACGGGGGGGGDRATQEPPESPDYIRLSNTSSTGETPFGYVAINVANQTARGVAGTLDHDGGAIRGGLLSGTINAGRTLVTLPDGRSAELSNPGNTARHARLFQTSGFSNDLFGVLGQHTNADDMPDMGSSVFNGRVEMQADNGDATFALTGNARITVGWDAGNNRVDSVFSNLDGNKNDRVGGGSVGVNNIGTVSITGATVSGTTFSGGTFSTTGDELAYTGGGRQVNAGQFFGPDATEVGGAFGLNKASELELSGVFIARGGLQ
ncbi:transferrin-binding protein-like solute binding protein [Yoonia sp. GPGPB17]|uniref:transferrin-binding protein-like solute binding protein n=1 Tax=Yoonia sp. GPGPB17 TaxID=3026147 RepID=UPI0030BEC258